MRRDALLLILATILATMAQPASAALLLHWKFDEVSGGNTTPDSSGNDYTGNLVGINDTDLEPGVSGNALRFYADADRVELPDADGPKLDVPFTGFTASMWVKPVVAAPTADNYLAGKMGGAGQRGWHMYQARTAWGAISGDLVFGVARDAAGSAWNELIVHDPSGPILSTSEFRHVAMVFDAHQYVRCYVNGKLVAQDTVSVLDQLNGANNLPLQVANRGSSASGSLDHSLDGWIDDAQIYDEALTAGQIALMAVRPGTAARPLIAEPLLSVDFNAGTTDPAVTQPGFEAFPVANGGADQSQTFGAVSVTLDGQWITRDRTAPADNPPAFTENGLLRDFASPYEPLSVTIEGLKANTMYDVSVWAYDADNYSVFTSDWFANGELLADDFSVDGTSDPSSNAQQRIDFLVTSTALGELLITGADSSTGDYRINAIQIRAFVPEPGTLGLAALGAAVLAICGWRRRCAG